MPSSAVCAKFAQVASFFLFLALDAEAEEAADRPFVVARVMGTGRFGIRGGEKRCRVEDAQAEEGRQREAASVAEKRQRQADDRKEADGHADVDADMDGEHHEHGDAPQGGLFVACPPGPMEADGEQ